MGMAMDSESSILGTKGPRIAFPSALKRLSFPPVEFSMKDAGLTEADLE